MPALGAKKLNARPAPARPASAVAAMNHPARPSSAIPVRIVAAPAAMPATNQPRSARQNWLAMYATCFIRRLDRGATRRRIQGAYIHHTLHPAREPAVVRGDHERAALGHLQKAIDPDVGRLRV